MVMIINIPRVLIQQVLHLEVAVLYHQHQRCYGQLPAGTRSKIADAAPGIFPQYRDKLLHIATLHRLTRPCIHLAGIVIRWIVREVAADDKHVFLSQIRLQHLCYPLQLAEVVSGNNDRHYGWNFAKASLQERQLHLQAMLSVVCLGLICKHAVSLRQLLSRLHIHLHVSQRSTVIVELRIHRSPVEPFVVTWPQQEYPFVLLISRYSHIRRSRHIP